MNWNDISEAARQLRDAATILEASGEAKNSNEALRMAYRKLGGDGSSLVDRALFDLVDREFGEHREVRRDMGPELRELMDGDDEFTQEEVDAMESEGPRAMLEKLGVKFYEKEEFRKIKVTTLFKQVIGTETEANALSVGKKYLEQLRDAYGDDFAELDPKLDNSQVIPCHKSYVDLLDGIFSLRYEHGKADLAKERKHLERRRKAKHSSTELLGEDTDAHEPPLG